MSENLTSIKAALEGTIDSVLDLVAKNLGLYPVRTGEYFGKSSDNLETYYPGYDYLKRYVRLAGTQFRVLIEFNGKEWLKTQNFDDLENIRQEELDFYSRQRIVPREWREVLTRAINALLEVKPEHYKPVLLSEERKALEEYIYDHFLKYTSDKNDARDLVKKAFKSRFFKIGKKSLFKLKIDKENTQKFYELIKE